MRLDQDEETLEAELEVRRSIKRADLTSFSCVSSGKLSVLRWFTLITKELLTDWTVERRNDIHVPESEGR